MEGSFEVASGSILGRHHRLTGKNNQDAYCSLSLDNAMIGVVCDGCGSYPHSEVGAKIGAQLAVQVIRDHWEKHSNHLNGQSSPIVSPKYTAFWQDIQQDLEQRLEAVIHVLLGSLPLSQVIRDYFLFTIMGVLINPIETTIFTVGDGCFMVNNQVKVIEPADNAPSYLAYNFLETTPNVHLQIQTVLPTIEVNSLLIGTDGVRDFIKAEEKRIPGKAEKVGMLSQFWQEDRYFHNPDLLRRRLALINRDVNILNPVTNQPTKVVGLLPDDTTLIAIRRRN